MNRLFPVLLLLSACSTESDLPELRALFDAQQLAWNAGDIDAFMEGYWNSDSLRFASSSGEILGFDALLARYLRQYPDRAAMGTLTFDIRAIAPLGNRHALVFGAYTLEREHDRPTGLYTVIAEYAEGRWRLIHDHTSADAVD